MADPKLITSPLSGPFTEGHMTVDVQIYRLEDTQWTLEVVDGEGTSTVWDDQFETAADAKAEFLRSVAEEGLVGAISGEPDARHRSVSSWTTQMLMRFQ